MWQEIPKERFEVLSEMISFLVQRGSVYREWWGHAEGSVEGLEVFCKRTKAALMTLTKDNVTNKYYMKEN